MTKIAKKIRYFFELIAVKIGIFIFKSLGMKKAANFGSFLARKIGKSISVQKLARNNIKNALPKLKDEEIEEVLEGMWDNLGRICGEYIHICHLPKEKIGDYVSIDKESLKNLADIKKNHNGGIIFSAHTGNWEAGPKFFLNQGIEVKSVYRTLNNYAVDKITSQARNVGLIAKSTKGNKEIIREIKKGNYIIILVDQKITDGIKVPFFHDKALTSASIAKLALKFKIPLIPARVIRIGKESKFKIEISKPIVSNDKLDDKNVMKLMTKVNKTLENWITQYPSQWFWVHNRWKK